MKTATIPSLRVAPELREAAESVLEKGETLSGFVEGAIRRQIDLRRSQRDFIARGLAAEDQAERTGEYFEIDDIMQDLDEIIGEADAKKRR
ncbi:MAG: YlcI/YnfO family protein [Pseudomonadota bacterium]